MDDEGYRLKPKMWGPGIIGFGRYAGIGGDSFMLIVKWPKDGGAPQTQTIYPFGAAIGRLGSPHCSDQAEMFPKEEFKDSPLPVCQ